VVVDDKDAALFGYHRARQQLPLTPVHYRREGPGSMGVHLSANKNLASVPVIVVSADHVTREVVLGAGATEYFEKPVAPDALLDAIARHAPGN
jgi:CheY-like chemotaxis protein